MILHWPSNADSGPRMVPCTYIAEVPIGDVEAHEARLVQVDPSNGKESVAASRSDLPYYGTGGRWRPLNGGQGKANRGMPASSM
jgi:hypothetical protein